MAVMTTTEATGQGGWQVSGRAFDSVGAPCRNGGASRLSHRLALACGRTSFFHKRTRPRSRKQRARVCVGAALRPARLGNDTRTLGQGV
eukprot:6182687-Pleurochrysis_carterae.AAC.2